MRIDLAGWESTGLRCPDVKVDLRRNGQVPKVALIQMPNGTGKTTTLQLLNAALSGSAKDWSLERVRSFRRKNVPTAQGCFKVTLLVDGKPLSLELMLDYEAGQVSYKSTWPGSGGVVPRWHVPPSVHRFLAPEFLSLFIFDGEFADRLLDSERAEADRAVDALCQLYLLNDVSEFARDYWERAAKAQSTKTSSGLQRLQEARDQLVARETKIKAALNDAKAKVAVLGKEILELDENIKARMSSERTVRERYDAAQLELVAAQGEVKTASAALMTAMRLPTALHPKLAQDLIDLRSNLERLKLPENTSAQFFEELVGEELCICGREMDETAIKEIRTRAKGYLDAPDAGVINNVKSDIERFTAPPEDPNEDAGFDRVERLAKALTAAVRREKDAELQVRALKQQLIASGDDQLAVWEAQLDAKSREHATYEDLITAIEGPGDAEESDDKIMSLTLIAKRLNEAKARIAEITETVRLRQQTELIQQILEDAARLARRRIKEELLEDCNRRLSAILANDPLEIERIDRSICLKDQDGASVGQTLSVGYTFLMSVLSRGNNDFPLIVDSPANPIDQGVRRQIGRLIPELCSQFVGFTINTERPGFVDTLDKYARDVAFLTLFRKTPGTQRLMRDLPSGRYSESANAVLVEDRDYFYGFDIEDEEEDDGVIQAAQ